MRGTFFRLLVLAVLASASPEAQQPATSFQSGVDLVALSVVVTDGSGKSAQGLSRADFSVTEDGIPQDLTFFSATPLPIDLALLLDTSASMTGKIKTVQQAAIGFVESLRPGDRVGVIDVKSAIKVLHPFNSDLSAARRAIETITPGGSTSLYNSVYMTLKTMMKERRGQGEVRRQGIIVLSDGDDTSSLVSFDDVMKLAKQSGVAIYTIMLRSVTTEGERVAGGGSGFAMKALGQETGARAFSPGQVTELAGVYNMISEELANQYALGYTSSNPSLDSSYRRIAVRVNRPGLRPRTRTGYFAAGTTKEQAPRTH